MPEIVPNAVVLSYRIEREIGRGGMAVVYRAHDERHDRTVALKIINQEVDDSLGADRFLIEIRLAARLNHPHIVALHDSGKIGGQLYYVMPFVDGPTLREYMHQRGKLSPDETVRFAEQIASALHWRRGSSQDQPAYLKRHGYRFKNATSVI